jgi:hypothetical protein
MARCEDFPCCGHEPGCCPSFDDDGNQLDMVCTCGARLPVTNRYSICDSCMRSDDEDDGYYEESDEDDFDDSMDGDHDSCMRDIGWGTDEDYGYYGDE